MKLFFIVHTLPKITIAFMLTLFFTLPIDAQTKRLKRPKSRVGVSSIDRFVQESFDLYDKVYKYDGYAAAGTPLDIDDIDVLEDALSELDVVLETAPDIMSDIKGISVLKQAKATLQVNRAKKALNYSIKTAKELLLGQREREEQETDSDEDTTNSEEDKSSSGSSDNDSEVAEETKPENISDNLEVYSKFDYVPGDKLLYFDDFSQDFIGDFPSKWNTNGSGEVVRLNNAEGNWFEMKAGNNTFYIPLLETPLPEEYTIEFDVLANGIDNKTSSTTTLNISLEDNDGFTTSTNTAAARIPFCQYTPIGIYVRNRINAKTIINNNVTADIRKAVLNNPHISIAVNKKRFRLWINEKKYIDIPQMIAPNKAISSIRFSLTNFKDDKERLFIKNLKIAEGGLDLRRTLMTEGRVSTNGILFDSGSANIKPQSYGIIRQISQVLIQDESINLNIIGHTDADGTDDANLKLSKDRAAAVRQALIDIYKIARNRLITDGKGESEPVGDNKTSDGKAQNRRVEFVKN